MLIRVAAVFAILLLAACDASIDRSQPQLPDRPVANAVETVPARGWHALLVAGDDSSPAFNNGIDTLREHLTALGVRSIHMLSASRTGAGQASAANVRDGLSRVGGDACLVYVTSHGDQRGFYLRADRRLFTPSTFEQALSEGCGGEPTVVVVSACHSGTFITPAMRKPNRIILTAAATERTSFGCGADDDYTYYDQCFLQQLDGAHTWRDVAVETRACVDTLERRLGVRQESRPQMYFGAEVANLRLPGR